MSTIDIVSKTEFGDQEGFLLFLGANELLHQQISKSIIGKGLSVQNLPLMDSPETNKNWLQDHYLMHQQEFQSLGLSIDNLPDLSVVDFKNKEQYDDWMENHATVHAYINQVLGIQT
jgi:hypothetical protein